MKTINTILICAWKDSPRGHTTARPRANESA